MKNNKKKERSIVILLIVAVLLMTVGFAAYAQQLTINGTAKLKSSPWDVHYVTGDNAVTKGTGSVDAESATLTNTDFTFSAKLEKPGDFYEAHFKVKNFGTIDALLDQVTMDALTDAQSKYLSYTVTYDNGTTYTATTAKGLGLELKANESKDVVVKVAYVLPEKAEELPTGGENGYVSVTVKGSLNYIDKTTPGT